MKPSRSARSALLAASLLAGAAGCDKPNDLPRLQDEAVASAKIYQQRIDDLANRAAAIGPRVAALPGDLPDAARARQIYQKALATIEERRRDLQQLPLGIQAGMKAGSPEELGRLIDHTREALEHGTTEAASALSAVESWVAIAEQRQTAPRHEADDRPQGSQAPAR